MKSEKSTPSKPRILAAIPCFNEAPYIGSVVLQTKKYVDQVIVIDDGSTDNTAEIARAAGAVVIKHRQNYGKGVAVSSAFREAQVRKAEVLVLLDGDGQHNPAQIPEIIRPLLEKKADAVVGSRFLEAKKFVPKYRTFGQSLLTWITNLGSPTRLTDSQSGFRGFSRKAVEVMDLKETGLSVESEMQLVMREKGLKILEVPVKVHYHRKAKRNPLAHGLSVLNRIMRMMVERRPLIYLGIPGLLILITGMGVGVITLNRFSQTRTLAIGHTLITVLLCIVGILILFVSLVLNSLTNRFSELEATLLRNLETLQNTKEKNLDNSDIK